MFAWVTLIAAAAAVLTPGLLPMPGTALTWPGWLWLLVVATVAAFTAAAVTAAGYLNRRLTDTRPVLISAAAAVILTTLPAGAALTAGARTAAAGWLVGTVLLAGLLLVTVRLRTRNPHRILTAVLPLAAAAPWAATATMLDDPMFVDFLSGQLLLLAATLVSVGALAAAARTAEKRHTHARRLLPPHRATVRTVALVLVAVAVATIARFTIAQNLFGDDMAALWTLRSPTSWPHAVLIAALIVVLVERSHRHPLHPAGQATVTWAYVAGSASLWLLAQVDAAGMAIRTATTGRVAEPWGLLDIAYEVGLIVVIATGWFLLSGRWANSAGRAMAAVGVAYLVPPLVGIIVEDRTDTQVPAVWATPAQVVVALIALVAAHLVIGLVTGRSWLQPRAAVRLLVVPALTVQGAALVPEVVQNRAGAILVVLAVTAGLLWSLPPVAADPTRHARVVLTASATAVMALTCYLLVSTGTMPATDVSVWAVLWLALPVSTALACDVRHQASPSRTPRITPPVRTGTTASAPAQPPPTWLDRPAGHQSSARPARRPRRRDRSGNGAPPAR
jgi:hypothetical protein